MFYTAEDRDRRLSSSVKERVIPGKSEKSLRFRTPVVGRLIYHKNIKSFSGAEALLAVIYELPDEGVAYVFDDPRTVGVVFVYDYDKEAERVSLPSIKVGELPSEYGGRIALLDPEGERLFISPDITTLNRYLPRLFQRSCDLPPSYVLQDGKKLSLSVILNKEKDEQDRNTIRPLPAVDNPEELYLRCSEIAESATGNQVTCSVSARDISVSSLCSLRRCAVWGDVSLLLCGLLCEEELTLFLQKFCHAFCELETDKREFNGYIKRGLLIDSPYLLWAAHSFYGIDFILFDAEKLLALISGQREDPPCDVTSYVLSSISSFVVSRGDIPCGVILGEKTLTQHFCAELVRCGVESFTTDSELFRKLYRILSRQSSEMP